MRKVYIFSHPDYTVGFGITPNLLALADCTADREFHPALKIGYIFIYVYIIRSAVRKINI